MKQLPKRNVGRPRKAASITKPASPVWTPLPKDRPTRIQPSVPIVTDDVADGVLPDSNPYDKAVAAGRITYAEAKTRDELHLIAEKRVQAKIESESAAIRIETERLHHAKERGLYISKEDYLARQETIVGTFNELARLIITDMSCKIPQTDREGAISAVTDRLSAAMLALSEAVAQRKPRDAVTQIMHDAFRGEE